MYSRPRVSPWLVITLGILTISTGSIFVRYAQEYAPSLVIAAFRLGIATLAIAPVAGITRRAELATLTRGELTLAGVSGIFLALHFATWITSLEYTTVASSVVLVTTTPLWVALLAPLTLKEPLSRWALAGMSLALVGGVIVGLSDSCSWTSAGLVCPPISDFLRGKAVVGDLLALAGALMAAAYVIIGRRLRKRLSLVSYIFIVYAAAGVVLVLIMLAAGHTPLGYPAQAYLWFTLLALVPQLLGHSSFNWALGYLPAAFVSITLLGEPLGSTLLAYLLLGEAPSILKVIGAILILAGIILASRNPIDEIVSRTPSTTSSTGIQ